MSILERLFQGELIFPLPPEEEHRFAQVAEKAQNHWERIKQAMPQEAETQCELQEQLLNWERLLSYQNGFLTATALWLELWAALGEERS